MNKVNTMYQLLENGSVHFALEDGSSLFLPPQDNGTLAWATYKAWLDEGNTPDPAPAPPAPVELTPAEKLAASGLTVEELKGLLGL